MVTNAPLYCPDSATFTAAMRDEGMVHMLAFLSFVGAAGLMLLLGAWFIKRRPRNEAGPILACIAVMALFIASIVGITHSDEWWRELYWPGVAVHQKETPPCMRDEYIEALRVKMWEHAAALEAAKLAHRAEMGEARDAMMACWLDRKCDPWWGNRGD